MLLATTLQSHTEVMPGLPSLGEKRWAHPLPLATIPPGAWHRYTPPCLCAPWHPSHSLICHSLTLVPSTGLAHGRQLSGPGQHLSPLPFSHINCVLSIVSTCSQTASQSALHSLLLFTLEIPVDLHLQFSQAAGLKRLFPHPPSPFLSYLYRCLSLIESCSVGC